MFVYYISAKKMATFVEIQIKIEGFYSYIFLYTVFLKKKKKGVGPISLVP